MAALAKAFYRSARSGDFQAAWEMLGAARRARTADKHMYGVGIACASRAGRIGWVDALWRELRHSDAPPVELNSHLSTAFITAYGADPQRSRLRSSRSVLSYARDQGFANTTTYNAFINAAARTIELPREGRAAGDEVHGSGAGPAELESDMEIEDPTDEIVAMVEEALAEMRNRGIAFDTHTLNSAISAFGRAGRLERALALRQEHADLANDVFVVNSLVAAAARNGDALLALELLNR
eukprot:scaffold13898_cov30-Tisochrysis_lutea.AAC.7